MFDPRRFESDADHADHRTPLDALIEAEESGDESEAGELDFAEVGKIPPDALMILLRFILPERGNPRNQSYWKSVGARVASIGRGINIEELREASLEDLAKSIGCTRALLSHHACQLRTFAALDCRAGKCESARDVYRKRAHEVWAGRNAARKAAQEAAGGL